MRMKALAVGVAILAGAAFAPEGAVAAALPGVQGKSVAGTESLVEEVKRGRGHRGIRHRGHRHHFHHQFSGE